MISSHSGIYTLLNLTSRCRYQMPRSISLLSDVRQDIRTSGSAAILAICSYLVTYLSDERILNYIEIPAARSIYFVVLVIIATPSPREKGKESMEC
jgi:hypothetical protein